MAQHEGEKKGERMRREREQHARAGKPHGGGRPFGFDDDRITIRDDEADLIREAARRVLAGESTYAVCNDLNDRGIVTATGKQWHTRGLQQLLMNPRYAGLRAYRGEVVADATWPPIIDRADHERLKVLLRSRRTPGRPGSRELVGLLRCAVCDQKLYVNSRNNRGRREHRYGCLKGPGKPGCGRIVIAAAPVEAFVREAVIAAVAGEGLAEARRRLAGDDVEQARAADELDDAETRLEELAAMYAAGDIGRREWLAARGHLDDRIVRARRTLARRTGALADLPGDEATLRQAWEDGGVDWRRSLLEVLLDRIVIHPATKGGPRLDPDRIGLVWRV